MESNIAGKVVVITGASSGIGEPYNIRSTIISPGPTDTDLPSSVTDPEMAKSVREQHGIAMPTLSVAKAIAFAISQPDEVDVNEIVLRPTALS